MAINVWKAAFMGAGVEALFNCGFHKSLRFNKALRNDCLLHSTLFFRHKPILSQNLQNFVCVDLGGQGRSLGAGTHAARCLSDASAGDPQAQVGQLGKAVVKRFGGVAGNVVDGDAAAFQNKDAHGGSS